MQFSEKGILQTRLSLVILKVKKISSYWSVGPLQTFTTLK